MAGLNVTCVNLCTERVEERISIGQNGALSEISNVKSIATKDLFENDQFCNINANGMNSFTQPFNSMSFSHSNHSPFENIEPFELTFLVNSLECQTTQNSEPIEEFRQELQNTIVDNGFTVNPQAIKEFKLSILNRDPEIQFAALQELMSFIQSTPVSTIQILEDALIEAEVVESLVETVNSLYVPVVSSSLILLEALTTSRMFVTQNKASVVLRSVLRTLLLFSEIPNDGVVLQRGLELVSKTIVILVREGKQLNCFCDMEQLGNVISTILNSPTEDFSILQSISQIVYTALQSVDASFHTQGNSKELILLVAKLLNHLCRTTHSSPDIDIDTAICEVGAACMRQFGKVNESINDDELDMLQVMIRAAMEKLIVPHIIQWESIINDENIAEIVTLLEGVLSIYHHPDETRKLDFTNVLVDAKFLKLLPSLEQFCSERMEQLVVVRSLIVEILERMCRSELGIMNWDDIVRVSLTTVPTNWMTSPLEASACLPPLTTTIIVYNYFNLYRSSSPQISVELFKDICTTLNLLESPPPSPVFKAVWLCFSVGYLSHGEMCPYMTEKGNNALINLTNSYKLDDIFTRNVAILLWAYNSELVTTDLKTKVMDLWIKNDDQQMNDDLKDLLTHSREAFRIYLDLLSSLCTDEVSVSKHLSLFAEVLQQCDRQYIELVSYDAWSLLPHMLLQSCLQVASFGVLPLLTFCSEFHPDVLDQDLLVRIACLVPGIVPRHNAIPFTGSAQSDTDQESPLIYMALFNFTWVLLTMSQEKNENMVLTPFLNHDRFIIALEYSFTLGHDNLSILTMELLSRVLILQHKHSLVSCRNIVITGEVLVKLLYSEGAVAVAAVKMLHSLIAEGDDVFSSNFILIVENPVDYIRIMYVRIHMICSVSTEEVACWCWSCLKQLLIYSQRSANLERHLAGLTYTHDLIKACPTRTEVWSCMAEFLNVWLPCQPPASRGRAMGNVALDDTLLLLAEIQAQQGSQETF